MCRTMSLHFGRPRRPSGASFFEGVVLRSRLYFLNSPGNSGSSVRTRRVMRLTGTTVRKQLISSAGPMISVPPCGFRQRTRQHEPMPVPGDYVFPSRYCMNGWKDLVHSLWHDRSHFSRV